MPQNVLASLPPAAVAWSGLQDVASSSKLVKPRPKTWPTQGSCLSICETGVLIVDSVFAEASVRFRLDAVVADTSTLLLKRLGFPTGLLGLENGRLRLQTKPDAIHPVPCKSRDSK